METVKSHILLLVFSDDDNEQGVAVRPVSRLITVD